MNTSNKKKTPDIQYGNTDLSDDVFAPKNVKRRITTFLDLDVLTELKNRAKKEGVGYQTKINQLLRDNVLGPSDVEKRLRKIEQRLFNHGNESSIGL